MNSKLPSSLFLRTYQPGGQEKQVLPKYARAYKILAALVWAMEHLFKRDF